jgi:AcrR family transcriptional regulator
VASAREILLATARDVVVAGDWERMPLAELAAMAKVSRQTLYKEFGSKDGLAQALSAYETELFMVELATVIEAYPDDPVAGTRAAVEYTLRTGADDPLLKSILSSARGPSDLLPMFTTRAEPLFAAARQLLTSYLTDHWPHLSTRDVSLVADSAIRLTVSHLVLPLAPIDRTADDLATLVERLLPAETTQERS